MKNDKKVAKRLSIAGLSFVALLILGFVTMQTPEKNYEIDVQTMHEKILSRDFTVRPERVAEILYSETDSAHYRFIDLRTPHEFIKGHIPGAVNIPIHRLFDPEFEEILNQNKKINILYYSDHGGACGPWMLLEQLGYPNNKIMLGGYDFAKPHVLDQYSFRAENYRDEKPLFDYARELQKLSQGSGSETLAPKTDNTPAPPVKKKKTEAVEGGC